MHTEKHTYVQIKIKNDATYIQSYTIIEQCQWSIEHTYIFTLAIMKSSYNLCNVKITNLNINFHFDVSYSLIHWLII